jgi:hypothetical protein
MYITVIQSISFNAALSTAEWTASLVRMQQWPRPLYGAVPINSSLLTVTLYSSVIKTFVYNGTKYSVPFMTL